MRTTSKSQCGSIHLSYINQISSLVVEMTTTPADKAEITSSLSDQSPCNDRNHGFFHDDLQHLWHDVGHDLNHIHIAETT